MPKSKTLNRFNNILGDSWKLLYICVPAGKLKVDRVWRTRQISYQISFMLRVGIGKTFGLIHHKTQYPKKLKSHYMHQMSNYKLASRT